VSLGSLPDEAYSLSVDNDIAAAAGLEEREDVYSNEDITTSNLEWNDNSYANPYTSLQPLADDYLQLNVIIFDNCVFNCENNTHILCLSHYAMCANCEEPSMVHKNDKEWLE